MNRKADQDRELLREEWQRQQSDHLNPLIDESMAYSDQLGERVGHLVNLIGALYDEERRTRLALLRRHGWMGVVVGCLILVAGAPQAFEDIYGTWTRLALGMLSLSAGIVLLIGQRWDESGFLELMGLALIGMWDLLFALSLIGVVLSYPSPMMFHLPWNLVKIPTLQPRLYPPFIYLTLASMVWGVHISAVARTRRLRELVMAI